MELISEIAKGLCPIFGNVQEASLETIDGFRFPVAYKGSDYISLLPNDTAKEIIYVRELSSPSINSVDLGGCQKALFVNSKLRIVFYSKTEYNTFVMTQKFYSALEKYTVQIDSIIKNVDSLLGQESGRKKHIRLKNVGYFAIDFSVTKEINKCELLDDCGNEL
jgi:hypothetical protein